IGAMIGIVALVSRAHGAGDGPGAAAVFRQGLRWALLVGSLAVLAVMFGETALRAVGHAPALVEAGGSVARFLAPGALAHMLFVAATFYLEGTGRPRAGLVAMLLANLVNITGNTLLIPEMGADGAALATTVARIVTAAALLTYVLSRPEVRAARAGPWAAGREMRVIGLASGAAFAFETMAFAALNQVAGLISEEALIAYTIAHSVQSLIFMIALGLSVAAGVRVGAALGRGELEEARFAGLSGLGATVVAMAVVNLGVMAFAGEIAGIYSTDAAVAGAAAALFPLLALTLLFDGGQVVMGQCCRAFGDSWQTTLRFFLAFWVMMVPLGAWLGFSGMGAAGLLLGTVAGCVVAVALFTLRFLQLAGGARAH
ncbi:MAG: MATE family efflux transporter, partial [Pseudomonadota bacterium]